MKTYVHLRYLTQFFLQWIFRAVNVMKNKTDILCSKIFLKKCFFNNVWKYDITREVIGNNVLLIQVIKQSQKYMYIYLKYHNGWCPYFFIKMVQIYVEYYVAAFPFLILFKVCWIKCK